MKKIGLILSVILTLVGFTGFIGGALISMGVVNYESELPLGDIKGIVVDDAENIYVGLGFYGKVQVYNSKGQFIKNWKVNSSGGTFNVNLTADQEILISTAREDKQIRYDQNGKVLSTKSVDNIYSATRSPWNKFTSNKGITYRVEGGIFPKITRTSSDKKVLVKQGLILHLMRGPFPVWLILAIGVGLNVLLRKDKIKDRMKKHSEGKSRFPLSKK